MNNRVIIGAGTSVPLSNIDKNGTEVPAPENEKNYGTAPKGIHFDKVPASKSKNEVRFTRG